METDELTVLDPNVDFSQVSGNISIIIPPVR